MGRAPVTEHVAAVAERLTLHPYLVAIGLALNACEDDEEEKHLFAAWHYACARYGFDIRIREELRRQIGQIPAPPS